MKILSKYEITHKTPILMHNPKGSMYSEQKGGKGPEVKNKPDPAFEAEASTYKMPDGQLYIPADAFIMSVAGKGGGAAGRKLGKRGAASVVMGAVELPDANKRECPLFHPKTRKPIKSYEIDIRRAVVKRDGILRARARVEEWACNLIVLIDSDFMTPEHFETLLNISGTVAGVLDYRPACHGWFGRYSAKLVKDK